MKKKSVHYSLSYPANQLINKLSNQRYQTQTGGSKNTDTVHYISTPQIYNFLV